MMPVLALGLKGLPAYDSKAAAVPVIRVADQQERNPAASARPLLQPLPLGEMPAKRQRLAARPALPYSPCLL